MPFCNMYAEKYPAMRSMIFSYMNGIAYNDAVDTRTKQGALIDLEFAESRDDALELIGRYTERSRDDVFRITLERIAHKKQYRASDYKKVSPVPKQTKPCPHCAHQIAMPDTTDYVICGYHNKSQGYDWKGCGRDWCFRCEKKLCKKWEINALHLQSNRLHNEECCAEHAMQNNALYPDEYCQCKNVNIYRDSTMSLLLE